MDYIYTESNSETTEITIFSIPKAFFGHIGIIQRNAIFSWTLLTPKPEIFLFGDEFGTKEICQELNLIHIPEVQRNQYNTPLLDGVFAEVHCRASNDIIAYLNADLILLDDFSSSVRSVSNKLNDYLLIGRRWNIDLGTELRFNLGWEASLKKLIQDRGCLADCDCKDYFVFPRHLFNNIPAFAVGRGYWDTWMVIQALADGYPVVDGSLVVTAVHQNHPYMHIRGGRNEAYMGREAQINKTLGNVVQPGDIGCATWQLKPKEYEHLPTISVVIIVTKQETAVEKAVLSVLVQEYQDYEIVVINSSTQSILTTILKPYQNRIKYFDLKTQDINPYSYGVEVAKGEFITFLDASSVLLPNILNKQVTYFEKEASTLDILLSGCKVIDEEKVIEYKLWEELPDVKSLHYAKLYFDYNFTSKTAILIRRSRLKLDKFMKLRKDFTLADIIFNVVYEKKCRVNWLKTSTQFKNY